MAFNFDVPIDLESYGKDSEEILGTPLRDKLHKFWLARKEAILEIGIDCYAPFTRSHEAFLKSESKERALLGGNSSAKTWTGAAFVVALATGNHPTIDMRVPNSGWIACEDFSLNKEGPLKAVLTLGKEYIAEYNGHDKIIKWKNGSETQLKSYESGWKKFQSAPKDYVWLDEEPPEEIYKECRMRTMRTSGYILTTMTPLEGLTWMYDMVFENENTHVEAFFASLYDNFTLKEEDIERTISDYSEQEMAARVYGKFTQMAGLVYSDFKRATHVIEPFPISNDFVVFRGIDPHITTPTACVWLAIRKTGEHILFDESFTSGNIEQIAHVIKEKSRGVRLGWTAIDSSARTDLKIYDRDIFTDFCKQGINCLPAPKGPGSIGHGISNIRKMLQANKITNKPTLLITKNCVNIIKAFQSLTREKYNDESKKGQKDKLEEGRFHHHAALRYIYQLGPRYFEPMSYVDDVEPFDEVVGY